MLSKDEKDQINGIHDLYKCIDDLLRHHGSESAIKGLLFAMSFFVQRHLDKDLHNQFVDEFCDDLKRLIEASPIEEVLSEENQRMIDAMMGDVMGEA